MAALIGDLPIQQRRWLVSSNLILFVPFVFVLLSEIADRYQKHEPLFTGANLTVLDCLDIGSLKMAASSGSAKRISIFWPPSYNGEPSDSKRANLLRTNGSFTKEIACEFPSQLKAPTARPSISMV